ncbi:hypothetical protein CBM2598_U10306 [Cupriavidus taiwanensis]|nr:hypothetical protein CBM2598_U10306 [Cupriavidus taiwanensis]
MIQYVSLPLIKWERRLLFRPGHRRTSWWSSNIVMIWTLDVQIRHYHHRCSDPPESNVSRVIMISRSSETNGRTRFECEDEAA